MWSVVEVSVFFFKQKTAYEIRISDWSSAVCSSDLEPRLDLRIGGLCPRGDPACDRTGIGGADPRPQPPLGRSRTEPRRYRDHPQRDRGGQEDGDRGERPHDHRQWGARQPAVDGAVLGVGAGAGLSTRAVPATADPEAIPSLCDETGKSIEHGTSVTLIE